MMWIKLIVLLHVMPVQLWYIYIYMKNKHKTYLSLSEVLLTVRFAVLLLHEGNPAQLAFLDEWLDIHSAKSIATDPFVILEHKPVLWT